MKTIYSLSLFILVMLLGLNSQAQKTDSLKTFILLRHAEKEVTITSDPALTTQGKLRAEGLASLLRDQKIAGIYSTTYRRTRETARPLAELKGLSILYYEPRQSYELIMQLLQAPDKGANVFVGHSNTIPELVNSLLGREAVAPIAEEDYGLVFIVTLPVSGKPGSLVTLRLPDLEQARAK